MSRDRSEELTRRLDELEATVRGLTEELVEVHARLAELEAQVDPDSNSDSTSSRSGVSTTEGPTSSEDVRSNERTTATKTSSSDAADSEETDSEDSDLDDIIVA